MLTTKLEVLKRVDFAINSNTRIKKRFNVFYT